MSILDRWDIARLVLGILIVACNWGVWRGVKLEESFIDWEKETGRRLLLRSLALEFFFAMVLLVVDTAGSIRQKYEIEALRSANLQLEAQIQPRRLTPYQQKAISDSLASFTGHIVRLQSYGFDTEGLILAQQLEHALKPWLTIESVIGSVNPMGNTLLNTGISVSGPNRDLVAAITNALRDRGGLDANNELPRFGLGTGMILPQNLPPPEASIFVGVKPLPK
jgi:hypothetical protein